MNIYTFSVYLKFNTKGEMIGNTATTMIVKVGDQAASWINFDISKYSTEAKSEVHLLLNSGEVNTGLDFVLSEEDCLYLLI